MVLRARLAVRGFADCGHDYDIVSASGRYIGEEGWSGLGGGGIDDHDEQIIAAREDLRNIYMRGEVERHVRLVIYI